MKKEKQKNYRVNFQDFHYSRQDLKLSLKMGLRVAEFFYSSVINLKNFFYKIRVLNEKKVNATVICVGNLTTGGVGKTPIVTYMANKIAKERKVAVVSRGYGAKISNKTPNVIKDFYGIKYLDGSLCGDEPLQIAKKVDKNVVVITCSNRKKAIDLAIIKYGIDTVILDDGFSNRKIKKDKTYLAIDSKMRFGNNHLLPYGPLREPISEIKRADEIILVNKGDENIESAIDWAKKTFKKPLKLSSMKPKRIYNCQSGADVKIFRKKAIAFCAIGQPEQFFDFARKFYDVIPVAFEDHYKYSKKDIKDLTKLARKNDTNILITTQKDETKLLGLIDEFNSYCFNVLELDIELDDIK